eukprot:5255242-Pleurochrysis_carterae.AAC.1
MMTKVATVTQPMELLMWKPYMSKLAAVAFVQRGSENFGVLLSFRKESTSKGKYTLSWLHNAGSVRVQTVVTALAPSD